MEGVRRQRLGRMPCVSEIDVWRYPDAGESLRQDLEHYLGCDCFRVREAEYYAMAEGVMRMKGVRASSVELGVLGETKLAEIITDSSAAKSFTSRRGLGRMRHVEVRWLWLQAEVASGRVCVLKLPGETNPADVDVGTKYLTATDMQSKLCSVNIEVDRKSSSVEINNVMRQPLGGLRPCVCVSTPLA